MTPKKILQNLVGKSVEEIVQAIKEKKITAQYILDSIYPSLSAEQRLPFHKAILTFGMPDPWTYEGHANYLRAGNDAIVALYELQEWDQALPIADEFYQAALVPSGPNSTNTYLAHSVATIYMKFNKIDKVLKLISNALDNNYDQAESMEHGPDFEALKKDPRFIKLFKEHHKKKSPTKASSTTYHVEFKKVTGVQVPKLLKDFGKWVGSQPHGSLGYFDIFGTWPIGDGMSKAQIKERLGYVEESEPGLLKNAIAIMGLPNGGELYLHKDGRVIHVGSEGEDPELLADSFEAFLKLLSEANTGVDDLDEVDEGNDAREELQEWLEKKVKPSSIRVPVQKNKKSSTSRTLDSSMDLSHLVGLKTDSHEVQSWFNEIEKTIPSLGRAEHRKHVELPEYGIWMILSHEAYFREDYKMKDPKILITCIGYERNRKMGKLDYKEYQGKLPLGITWNSSREDLRNALGHPDFVNENRNSDGWRRGDFWLILCYNADFGSVKECQFNINP